MVRVTVTFIPDVIEGTAIQPKANASTTVYATIDHADVVAIIAGGTSRKLYVSGLYNISAVSSYNGDIDPYPELRELAQTGVLQNLYYSWSCVTVDRTISQVYSI